jgi:hypothetical protein
MFSVKRRLMSAIVFVNMGLALAVSVKAQEVPIPILNPKFDMDVLTGAVYASQVGITGWIADPYSGVLRASTTQYPSAPSTGLYCHT